MLREIGILFKNGIGRLHELVLRLAKIGNVVDIVGSVDIVIIVMLLAILLVELFGPEPGVDLLAQLLILVIGAYADKSIGSIE